MTAPRTDHAGAAGPPPPRAYRLTVARTRLVTPRLARITLTGADLAELPEIGPEPRCKVLLPPAPGARLVVPRAAGRFWDAMNQLPARQRPVVRTYTVRAARRVEREVDIDFVLHGDAGPASRWASAARPGDPIGLYGCLSSFQPPADTERFLLVGDETALPAISGIAAALPPGVEARAIVEVGGAEDEQPVRSPAALRTTWLHRGGAPAGTGDLLHGAVRALPPFGERTYVWAAGESAMTRRVREDLVLRRDLTRQWVHLSGYWRRGHAEDDD